MRWRWTLSKNVMPTHLPISLVPPTHHPTTCTIKPYVDEADLKVWTQARRRGRGGGAVPPGRGCGGVVPPGRASSDTSSKPPKGYTATSVSFSASSSASTPAHRAPAGTTSIVTTTAWESGPSPSSA